MATRAQKLKVLLFLAICVGVMAAGLAIIQGFTHVPMLPYYVEFTESVLGLYPGAYVVYQGVPVGKVKDIDVLPSGHARVLIHVEVDKVTLHQGVKAQLVLYSLATGSLAVNLYGGESDAPPLPAGSSIESEISFLGAAGEQTSVLLKNLSDVADAVNKSLEGIEEGDFARLIKRTDELVEETKETVASLREQAEKIGSRVDSGTESFQRVTEDLIATSQEIRTTVVDLRSKINALDTAQVNADLADVLQKGGVLLERLQKTAESLDHAAGNVLQDTQHVQYKFKETLDTVHETVAALHDLIEYLREDPSALVRGKGKAAGGR